MPHDETARYAFINLRLKTELKEQIETAARASDRSLNSWFIRAAKIILEQIAETRRPI